MLVGNRFSVLLTQTQDEKNDRLKALIRGKIDEYLNRAEKIKEYLQAAEKPRKAVGANGSSGAAATKKCVCAKASEKVLIFRT